MLLIALVLIVILGLLWPKSKWVIAISIIFMVICYSFLNLYGDIQNYQAIYDIFRSGSSTQEYEPGFTLLVQVCNNLSVSFTGFRVICAIIYAGLLSFGICRLTKYSAMVIALTCIFPLFIFISVIRSGIACAIAVNAFAELKCERKLGLARFKFIVLILLATLFHYSSILMLLFLVSTIRLENYKIIFLATLVVLFTILLNYTDVILNIITTVTGRDRTIQYFEKNDASASIKGFIAIIILLGINIWGSIRALDIVKRHRHNDPLMLSYAVRMKNVTIILFCFLPLMVFASPFMRIAYMVFPVLIAYFTDIARMDFQRGKIKDLMLCGAGLVAYTIIWLLYANLPNMKDGYFLMDVLMHPEFIIFS